MEKIDLSRQNLSFSVYDKDRQNGMGNYKFGFVEEYACPVRGTYRVRRWRRTYRAEHASDPHIEFGTQSGTNISTVIFQPEMI